MQGSSWVLFLLCADKSCSGLAPEVSAAVINLPPAGSGFMWIPQSAKVNQTKGHVADRQRNSWA